MTLTKIELKRQIKKFLQDPNRGISQRMFAQLCGINMEHMRDVFLYETVPLTEMIQTRVNKGYDSWKKGIVRTMKSRDNKHFVDYRKEPKPVMAPSYGLQIKNGQIAMRVGMVNQHDYSQRDLIGDKNGSLT